MSKARVLRYRRKNSTIELWKDHFSQKEMRHQNRSQCVARRGVSLTSTDTPTVFNWVQFNMFPTWPKQQRKLQMAGHPLPGSDWKLRALFITNYPEFWSERQSSPRLRARQPTERRRLLEQSTLTQFKSWTLRLKKENFQIHFPPLRLKMTSSIRRHQMRTRPLKARMSFETSFRPWIPISPFLSSPMRFLFAWILNLEVEILAL